MEKDSLLASKAPSVDSLFTEQELLAFARASLGHPASALSALRKSIEGGVSSWAELGISEPGLTGLINEGQGEERELEKLLLAVIWSQSEPLNIVLANALESVGVQVELQERWSEELWTGSEQAGRRWIECESLFLGPEVVVEGVSKRPEIFEGPRGVERVQDALDESDRHCLIGGFWTRLGPNALKGAALRSLEEQDWGRFHAVCEALCDELDPFDAQGNPLPESDEASVRAAQEALRQMSEAAGSLSAAQNGPSDAIDVLAILTAFDQMDALEAFARAAHLERRPFKAELFSCDSLSIPSKRFLPTMRFHIDIEDSSLLEEPFGLRGLGLLWKCDKLVELADRVGEPSSTQAAVWAQSMERFAAAAELEQRDSRGAEALAQSAALLWESRGADQLAPRAPTPRI